ncbi:MAG: hypothetical protein RL720_266 [Actinomycetota bacterium]|jgi:methionine-gamma-lyase
MNATTPSAKRPDKQDLSSLSFATQSVHAGNVMGDEGEPVRTPIVMANAYTLPEDPSEIDWSDTSALTYTRNSGMNQVGLQRKLAALEHGEDAVVFTTGVSALFATFFTFLNTGDHVVVGDTSYQAVWRLMSELLPKKYGIEATFVDMSDLDAVRQAMRPTTKLVHTEIVANPTTKVANIDAIAAIAHESGALLSVDSTYTPPPLFRPLEHGADIVTHSLTKYINGHGDAMGGVSSGSRELMDAIREDALVDVGGTISPFNAWLIMRGSVTLPLRMRQIMESAQRIAEMLEKDPRVAYVYYPGLTSHPEHEIATRLFEGRGFGGMLAFAIEGDSDLQNTFVSNLKVITSAFSLGHDESLIVHVAGDTRGGSEHYPEVFKKYGHLRLSVGLEECDDLLSDIRHALDETSGPLK